LPQSVTDAITDAVQTFVHGAASLDDTVSRVADIMWFYINE